MNGTDTYKTISTTSGGIYKEKGSRFLARAYPVSGEEEIKRIINEVRKEYFDARHHCYAYILGVEGILWRANDDGEPPGSAGKPILGQIKSFGLTNILVIVSRFFGGTMLGVSGLFNAYRSAAESALSNAEKVDHIVHEFYEIKYSYPAMNSVMKIIKEEDIIKSEHSFESECRMVISFRLSARERILKRFSRIEGFSSKLLYTR